MTLLHSLNDQIHNELVLLAPPDCYVPESFRRRYVDRNRHARWLSEAQKVRGRIYLSDGAVQESQLKCGWQACATSRLRQLARSGR